MIAGTGNAVSTDDMAQALRDGIASSSPKTNIAEEKTNPFMDAETSASTRDAAIDIAKRHGQAVNGDSAHRSALSIAANLKREHGFTGDELSSAVKDAHEKMRADDPNLRVLPDGEIDRGASWADETVTTKSMSPVGRIRPLAELRAMPQAVDWLIDGMFRTKRFGYIYGASGIGKTWVALDMALHIANGVDWLDRPTRQGVVIWVGLEGTEDLPERVEGLLASVGADATDEQFFYVEDAGLDLTSPRSVDAFIREIQSAVKGPVALIVIDTWSLALGGGSEQSNDDTNDAIRGVRRIISATGATVLGIHHPGHDKSRARGAYALHAGADFEWNVAAGKTGGIVLGNEKMRGAKKSPDFRVRLRIDGGTFQIEPWKLTREVTPDQARIWQFVRDLPQQNQSQIARALEMPRSSVAKALEGLEGRSFVVSEAVGNGKGYSVTDQSPSNLPRPSNQLPQQPGPPASTPPLSYGGAGGEGPTNLPPRLRDLDPRGR